MNRYLLDTNHLSAYLDRQPQIEQRIDAGFRAGHRFGICLPVLCEYRSGIRAGTRFKRNLARLQGALCLLRIWPADEQTAVEFAELFTELRSVGRVLAPFDHLIAAVARQYDLILLTSDQDFDAIDRLKVEDWR
jgi:predicted nucleic acid-binding protein